jgi:hypothetical protein
MPETPQLTIRLDETRRAMITEHVGRRPELDSETAVIRQAIDLYCALENPDEMVEPGRPSSMNALDGR